jgi:hypothetical protein
MDQRNGVSGGITSTTSDSSTTGCVSITGSYSTTGGVADAAMDADATAAWAAITYVTPQAN